MLFYRPQRLASFPVFIVGMSKGWGLWNVCSGPHPLKVVVAVSYSPTPSQVQYHRRLRA